MDYKITLYTPQELVGKAQTNELIKLRDMDASTRLGRSKTICIDLLLLLGVNGDNADPMHHARAITFISSSLQNYAPEEIIFAFQKAIKGDFNIDIYQQLNSLVIGRVMREYTRWLENEIERAKPKQETPTQRIERETLEYEKEKFGIIELADRISKEFKLHGKIINADKDVSTIYRHVFKKGLLPKHDNIFKEDIKCKAIPLTRVFLMESVQRGEITKVQLNEEMKKISNDKSNLLNLVAQKIIIEEYMLRLEKEQKKLIDVI